MKKLLFVAVVLLTCSLLTACGAQKNDLDTGHALVKADKCGEAQVYLENTIAHPEQLMDLAYAYFLKGQCAERSGDFATAYENFYAAKVVTCYGVSIEEHTNLNTYARSEYCQKIIPKMLDELEPRIDDPAKVDSIISKVDSILTARYLERFNKRLQ